MADCTHCDGTGVEPTRLFGFRLVLKTDGEDIPVPVKLRGDYEAEIDLDELYSRIQNAYMRNAI